MCRNLLLKYGVEAFPPRYEIEGYKKTLCPIVTHSLSSILSASVSATNLRHSTLNGIVSNESLHHKLCYIPNNTHIIFVVKAGLDGSQKRH